MQFLDLEEKMAVPVDPSDLEPDHRYGVLLFLQNDDPVEHENVTVTIWHDTFEVGLRGLSSLIVQPDPVEVPARVKDAQGVVMVRFVFMTPSAGRGRLAAKVLPSGPSVMQPVSIRHCGASNYASDSSQASA